jgi:hypothetical protein
MCSLNRIPAPALARYHFQRGLAALKRIRTKVVAVEFNQIDGVEEDTGVIAPVADAVALAFPA